MIPSIKPNGWPWWMVMPRQIDYIQQAATKYEATVVIILDIIHVLKILWKATNTLFDPDDANSTRG